MRDLSSFTDIDRHDFERLPQYFVSLDEKASVRIWLKGGVLVDFRDRELYLLCPNLEPPDPKVDKEDERSRLTRWTWPVFGFRGEQAQNYIAVHQGLRRDWVEGRKIRLEGLVEVNLCRGPVRQAMLMLAPPEAKTKLLRTAREKGDLAWRRGEDIAAAIARALAGEDEAAGPPPLTLTADDTAKRLLRQRPRTQQLLLELLGHHKRGQQLKPELLEQVKGMPGVRGAAGALPAAQLRKPHAGGAVQRLLPQHGPRRPGAGGADRGGAQVQGTEYPFPHSTRTQAEMAAALRARVGMSRFHRPRRLGRTREGPVS